MRKYGYGYALDLLFILPKLHVPYPTRSGCREKNICLSTKLFSLCWREIYDGEFSWMLEIGRIYYNSTIKVDEHKNNTHLLATPICHLWIVNKWVKQCYLLNHFWNQLIICRIKYPKTKIVLACGNEKKHIYCNCHNTENKSTQWKKRSRTPSPLEAIKMKQTQAIKHNIESKCMQWKHI